MCENKGTCTAREMLVWERKRERDRERERRRKFGHHSLGFMCNRGVIINGERRRRGW